MFAREAAQRVVVAIFGKDHAAVGHDGFGKNERDVVFGQCGFKRFKIVELDDDRVGRDIADFADEAGAVARFAVFERDEGVVDGAVIATVEDQEFASAGCGAGPANDGAIGVGGGGGHLPEWELEALGKEFADDGGIGARQHGG